jgi:HEAT repeat protein
LAPGIEALQDKLLQTYLAGLQDNNPRIRRKAARGLGYLGRAAADAVPALTALREDGNPAVRQVAHWALARITAGIGVQASRRRTCPRPPRR